MKYTRPNLSPKTEAADPSSLPKSFVLRCDLNGWIADSHARVPSAHWLDFFVVVNIVVVVDVVVVFLVFHLCLPHLQNGILMWMWAPALPLPLPSCRHRRHSRYECVINVEQLHLDELLIKAAMRSSVSLSNCLSGHLAGTTRKPLRWAKHERNGPNGQNKSQIKLAKVQTKICHCSIGGRESKSNAFLQFCVPPL